MKELVIISGKGGTGKTSIAASLGALADNPVLVDCDVDAADLHIILRPSIQYRETFKAGNEAIIREADCTRCGICYDYCRFDAIQKIYDNDNKRIKNFYIIPYYCEGCGVCVEFCPERAVDFNESISGEWYISKTRFGPLVHARLGIAAENSGKLVTIVRNKGKEIAKKNQSEWLLIDGPPGIGCPVIASITGATIVLIVVEPTLSGEHDMQRVISLAGHFKVPAMICINKWDINNEITDHIEKIAKKQKIPLAGRIRYDESVTKAQVNLKTIIEQGGIISEEIKKLWNNIRKICSDFS